MSIRIKDKPLTKTEGADGDHKFLSLETVLKGQKQPKLMKKHLEDGISLLKQNAGAVNELNDLITSRSVHVGFTDLTTCTDAGKPRIYAYGMKRREAHHVTNVMLTVSALRMSRWAVFAALWAALGRVEWENSPNTTAFPGNSSRWYYVTEAEVLKLLQHHLPGDLWMDYWGL